MTRQDLRQFSALKIDFDSIGLMEPGEVQEPYFCTPTGVEYVGRLGCDGIHFVLLPGDERIFCVDPSMGEVGTYVLPVASDFREFLSFLLYCRDASPLSQIYWMTRERFDALLREDRENRWEGCEDFFARKEQALAAVEEAFGVTPQPPYEKVRAMQAAFDPSVLRFSGEYYDVLGLEQP